MRTPTPRGYGNSTHLLTLEVIEIASNKRPSEKSKHMHKKGIKELREERQTNI